MDKIKKYFKISPMYLLFIIVIESDSH